MSYIVIWSPTARSEFSDILSYLDSLYGVDVALSFLEKTEKIASHLGVFPYSFPLSNQIHGIRKAVITKQSSLLYKIQGQNIRILHIWDNRQDFSA